MVYAAGNLCGGGGSTRRDGSRLSDSGRGKAQAAGCRQEGVDEEITAALCDDAHLRHSLLRLSRISWRDYHAHCNFPGEIFMRNKTLRRKSLIARRISLPVVLASAI